MNTINLSIQQLRQAADLKEKIQALERQLGQILGGSSGAAASTSKASTDSAPRRKMSASAIAKIRAAQKKRWAKIRSEGGGAKPAAKKSSSQSMTSAQKSAVSARMKAYWAARRAANK